MPRERDLQREGRILRLRSQGLGVRQIAKEVGASPSTVSRTLRREPTRRLLAELTQKVELGEQKMAICEECLRLIGNLSIQWGPHFRQQILDVLMKWPENRFRHLYLEGKL
jgi:predicted transcriptional regulator